MDIPEAARLAKKAQIARENPTMVKYPQVAEQFLEAQLADEWSREPMFPGGVFVEEHPGEVKLVMRRAPGGNGINAPLTMPEAYALHAKLSAALGL